MNALLAYRLNRTYAHCPCHQANVDRTSRCSFVYYNYTWRDDGTQFSRFNDKWIPSTIPLTALLAGKLHGVCPSRDLLRPAQGR